MSSNVSAFPVCSVNTSVYPAIFECFSEMKYFSFILAATLFFILVILPVYAFILWTAFRSWRRGRAASHADVFTCCMATAETSIAVGLLCNCYGVSLCRPRVIAMAFFCILLAYTLQTYLHFLTCVDRYLAVVHPVTYRNLKRSRGVGIRNLSILCVYFLCSVIMATSALGFPALPTLAYLCVLSVIAALVCCLSSAVVRVLRRPGLGSRRVKRRALQTVAAITGVLLLRFSAIMVMNAVMGEQAENCHGFYAANWLCIPCSLVMPGLFLHRRLSNQASRMGE